MSDKPEIEIDIYSDNAAPKPGDFRYMYVLFTLEHRAYSVGEAKEVAERMKAANGEDVYCVKVDCGEDDPAFLVPALHVPAWLVT